MKYSIDEAISILQDFVETDRIIRDGDTESDYSKYCEEKCEAIKSLIEYVYANKCAFKTSNVINKVETTNTIQLNETDLKKILACLNNCTFVIDDEYLSEEQRIKLIDYNYDILYKICDILGIVLEDININIDTLEIKKL